MGQYWVRMEVGVGVSTVNGVARDGTSETRGTEDTAGSSLQLLSYSSTCTRLNRYKAFMNRAHMISYKPTIILADTCDLLVNK